MFVKLQFSVFQMWRVFVAAFVPLLFMFTWSAAAQSGADATPAPETVAPSAPSSSSVLEGGALESRIDRIGTVPSKVIDAAIEGRGATANQIIGRYIADGNASPGTRVARAVALIRQASRDGRVEGRLGTSGLVDRVSVVTRRAVNSPLVFNVAVQREFVPPPSTVALDLGPADGRLAVGFTAADPTSEHVSGDTLTAHRQTGGGALLSDGIAGIKSLTFEIPNGSYRVVLLADRPSQGTVPAAPFGETITANYDTYYLGRARPAQWLERAWIADPVLNERDLREVYRRKETAARELLQANPERNPGGYGYGIAFQTEVIDGYLKVALNQPKGTPLIYLSAVIVQPSGQPAVWQTDRTVVTNSLAHRFIEVMDLDGKVTPQRAAALIAYSVHERPEWAEEIVWAGLRLFPEMAPEIAEAVNGLPQFTRDQVVRWVDEAPAVSTAHKRTAINRLPRVQEAQGNGE